MSQNRADLPQQELLERLTGTHHLSHPCSAVPGPCGSKGTPVLGAVTGPYLGVFGIAHLVNEL